MQRGKHTWPSRSRVTGPCLEMAWADTSNSVYEIENNEINVNSAHMGQSSPEYVADFQEKVLHIF